MKELSPFARQLVEAGKNAWQPADADKARVHEALQQHLPATPQPEPPGDPNPPPTAVPPTAPWPLISALTVGAGALVGALYWGFSSEAPSESPAPPRASVALPQPVATSKAPAPTPTAKAPEAEEEPPRTTAAQQPAAPRTQPRETTRPKSQLAAEVALLSKATSALNAGRADEALRVLAEHQRKFPSGRLSVERRGARAQALCLLGRKAEAERELRRLSPSSPQAARARKLCGGK